MKFLIFFALAFATVWANNLYFQSIEKPVLENEGRITRGETASQGQFKYEAGLDFNLNGTFVWSGGSLIGENWVLTCAHSIINSISVAVYLGSTVIATSEKVHYVAQTDFIPHPLYNPGILKHDIALIRIPTTNASSNIGFVKISNNNDNKYLGRRVFVTGWGQTESEDISDVLKFAILKVSTGNPCFEQYGLYYDDDVHICVATPDKVSPCHGDSGGPLVLQGRILQIGVMSFGGSADCMDKKPVVFTRVSAYRLWIYARTGIRGALN